MSNLNSLAQSAATLIFGATVLASATAYAQSTPFAGLAGVWSGGGTITLEDGSNERIRCRASYAVGQGGSAMNQTLTCASDSYKFDLRGDLTASGEQLTGSWSEASRGVSGTLSGRGGNGQFNLAVTGPGFDATLSLRQSGSTQTVSLRSPGQFKSVNISLKKS